MTSTRRLTAVGLLTLTLLGTGCGAGAPSRTTTPARQDEPAEDEPARHNRAQQTEQQTGTQQTDTQQTDTQQTGTQQTGTQQTGTQQTGTQQASEPPRTDTIPVQPPDSPELAEHAPAPTSSQVAPPLYATQRARLAVLERQVGELEQVAELVASARPAAQARPGSVPPICADRQPIETLRVLGIRGAAGSGSASAAADALDVWCARFDLWSQPDDRVGRVVERYFQLLDRITGWMRDIQRCAGTTGAERARCENAYSSTTRVESDEAGRVLALLDEHRRELAGVQAGSARFPCTTPVLMRLESSSWVGSTARAQMTSLPREAEGVCHAMGVSERDLRDAARVLGRGLDQAESSARSERRSLLEAAEALRPVLGH